MNKNRGFTLIEMVIYIGLFSIIMAGLITVAFQLSQSAGETSEKVVTEKEINFILKKFDWVFTGALSESVDITSGELSIENPSISSDPIILRLNADGEIEI